MLKLLVGSIACLVLAWILPTDTIFAADVETPVQAILKVDKEGAGHAAAVPVLRQLVNEQATALIPLLRGMDHANPLAQNWLRGAFEAIADRNLKAGKPLPKMELEKYVLDRTHATQSRKLAFDWLVRIDPSALDRLVPGMADDPSEEFRREGVQRLIDAADKANEAKDTATSKDLYRKAFDAALDPDQLERVTKVLSGLGEKPDLKRHLGLLDDWWLIGPFDNHNKIGFDTVYPPEKEVDLQKKYAGKGAEVSWVKKESGQDQALVDLNKLVAPHKGAVMYATREFVAERAGPVEIRLGTPNGWKLWVNGKPVFGHEEYHFTMRMDQYPVPASFKAGNNRILLKVCQDEQSADWAQRWEFQVRVCDSSGKAILPVDANASDTASVSSK